MKRSLRGLVAVPVVVIVGVLAVPFLTAAGGTDSTTAPGAAGQIPPRVLKAYIASDGACPGLRWQILAGIGWVESRHGTSGGAATDPETGEVTPWILGPPLDGRAGTERHLVGPFLGEWGLAGPYEQAVGPMQFRPPTFADWSVDADEDGTADPHDLDDAVATAARYLCGTDGAVTDERTALLRYNASAAYVEPVLAYADGLALPLVIVDGFVCPVAGPTGFTDTWGAPRSGGRRHQGVDMFAVTATPVVAPVAGEVNHYNDSLGGLSFRLFGDDGNFYYGTHLSAYGAFSGHVPAGAVVGYVGSSGNARGAGAHLHFEIHPGRGPGDSPSPVNPTPVVAAACTDQRLAIGLELPVSRGEGGTQPRRP